MSASCYTNRIKVKTQARNGKVQYPGGQVLYNNAINATCGVNPDYTILKYTSISLACLKKRECLVIPPVIPSCLPAAYQILNGQTSAKTVGCIFDGGFSDSNYSDILNGNFSCSGLHPIYDGTTSSANNYNILEGGSSVCNFSNILDAGKSVLAC